MVNIGKWAFLAGIVLAVLTGFFTIANISAILLVLGVIVGFLNITEKEVQPYLVAVTALLVIGVAGLQAITSVGASLGYWVETVLANFLTFVAASGAVVAIRSILILGKND